MRSLVGASAVVAVAALVAAAGTPLGAQSITSATSPGYPLQPVDARTEVLDGLGIGLQGFAAPMTNPALYAGALRRGFVFAVENNNRTVTLGDETGETGATRFPLLRLVFPVRYAVLSLGYGSVLDQAWGVVREGTVMVGTQPVDHFDRIESTGGLGQLQLGAAASLGERVAIGATVGALTGNQRIRTTRAFQAGDGQPLEPFDETDGWRYSGMTASLGATWDPANEIRIGASLSWMGTVTADSAGGRAAARTFDGPVQVGIGASGYLAPTVLLTASGRWSGWSATEPVAAGGLATVGSAGRDTWEWGAGVEWDNPESRSLRSYPIRAGFQYRQLPFAFGAEAPTEWFAGLGAGMRIGTDIVNPLARLDVAVQRGERTAAGDALVPDLEERIWRFALTVTLFGN